MRAESSRGWRRGLKECLSIKVYGLKKGYIIKLESQVRVKLSEKFVLDY